MLYFDLIPGSTHTNPTEAYTGYNNWSGAIAPNNQQAAYDGDVNTKYYAYYERGGSGDFNVFLTCDSQHEWADPVTIKKVYYKLYNKTDASGNYPNCQRHTDVSLKINGVWTSIYYNSGGNGSSCAPDLEHVGPGWGWELVTGMRATVYAHTGGDRSGHAWCDIYELKAYKEAFAYAYTGALPLAPNVSSSTMKFTPTVYSFAGSLPLAVSSSTTYRREGGTVWNGSIPLSITPSSTYRQGNKFSGNVGIVLAPTSVRKRVINRTGGVSVQFTPAHNRVRDILRTGGASVSFSPIAITSKEKSDYKAYNGEVWFLFGVSSTTTIRQRRGYDPKVKAGCPLCGTMLYNK